jgi:acetylornithine deacetylase/succinyl-diaminopimelate desuccinylase-like protein
MYDMKSLAVAQLAAVEGVVAERHATGRRPRRSLLLLATSSEETGSETGTRWILERHPELVGRMAAVWTEGGVVEARSAREVKYWGIEFAQKRFGRVDFCSSDRARLERLRTLLNEDHAARPRLPIDPGVEAFLERYAKTRGLGLYRKLLAEPEEVVTRPERFRQLTPFLRSLFREEMAAAPIRQDPDGTYRLTVALHLFASSDVDAVLAELLPEWKTFGTSVTELRMASPGAISRLDHWAFTEAAEAVRRAHPEAEVGPYFLPWTGTDARYFRAAGIPTYGFSPFLISVTDTLQIGRANERMQLPGFVRGIELYRDAVRRALR